MSDSLGRMAAAYISIIMMFLVPITIVLVKQDDTRQVLIDDAVVEFIDNARASGEISPTAYDRFVSRVSAAYSPCDIQIYYESSHETPVPTTDAAGNFNGYTYKRALQTYGKDDITDYMFYETDAAGNVIKDGSGRPVDADEKKDFPLKEGGYISAKVTNLSSTPGTNMIRLFLPQYGGKTLLTSYGGYVGNNKQ